MVKKMGEQMEFPETFEKFAKEYGFKDDKEIYTNGSELIPIFRVKQWLEYDNKLRAIETDTAYECGKHANKWIPVSERLPEKDGEYLVTVSFHFCGEIVFKCSFATDLHKVDEYEFPEHKCGFYGIDSECGSYEINDVIAWVPSPEPYRKESEE